MKANELRANNIVSFVVKNHVCEVVSIDIIEDLIQTRDLNQEITNAERGIDDINPIKLTKRWLNQTDLIEGISIHNKNFSGIIKVVKANYIDSFELYIGSVHIKNVDYIHELQNLFHSLTDTELPIKQ